MQQRRLCLYLKFTTRCHENSCCGLFRIAEPECPVDPPSNLRHGSPFGLGPPGQSPSLHRSGWLSPRHRWMARCELCRLKSARARSSPLVLKLPFFCVQYILVTADDAIIASAPAPLCDGESHEVLVTISGNRTMLLVDGRSGRRDDAEVPTDLLSQSSTFIGGLPGEQWNKSVRIKPLLKWLAC